MNIHERYGRQTERLEQLVEKHEASRLIAQYPNQALDLYYFASQVEKEKVEETRSFKPPHIRPDSVCVAGIGYNWEPGAWQKVTDMVDYTNKQNVCCWLTEVVDRKVSLPFHDVNVMRNKACMHAHDLGFEWVLLIENEALPEPDLLIRLLKWGMPIVMPYIRDETLDKVLAGPEHKRNTGLRPVRWAALNCILIWTKVLNCIPDCMPFRDNMVESDFYDRLFHYGHTAYVDTNVELKVARRPTYPADRKNLKEYWDLLNEADKRRRQKPNRRPIDPNDKRKIYLPR